MGILVFCLRADIFVARDFSACNNGNARRQSCLLTAFRLFVIMPLIHVATMFYNALIFQGEIW